MARRKVEEVRCDRCKKVEYQDEGADTFAMVLSVRSSLKKEDIRRVEFDDLCSRCLQIVLNYVDKIDEVSRSSSVAKKKEEGGRAVNGQLPPPHS